MVVGEFTQKRQLIIAGGGPGGYNAAIRAAQLGMEVTIIEKEKLGGVCLNTGCIPSKTLTHAAAAFASLSHLNEMGIQTGEAGFELQTFKAYQQKTVSALQKGVEALCKANKIEVITGTATFMSGNRIGVDSGHHYEMYEYEKAIIAVGASPVLPHGIVPVEGKIISADELPRLQELPEHLVISGSDYIALETAMAYRNLGSEVSVICEDDTFGLDESISKELHRVLKKSKIKLFKNSTLLEAYSSETNVAITIQSDQEKITLDASHLMVSGESRPNTKDLGLEFLNISTDKQGFIMVNEFGETNVDGIYAAGDCTIGRRLASKAIKQGKVAAEHISGMNTSFNLALVPLIIQTVPPIASVGLTEGEARQQGYEVKTGQFAMGGNGFASIAGQKDGLTKMVIDEKTDLLLGVHMMGAGAAELIQAGTTALEMVARDEDIAYPVYAHPSLSEAWLEAVEHAAGKAIHIPPARKKATSRS
ncbi:dihydrolipoyl dehydrogenase [Fictibacillus sp. WQ 8-8]|uniref:dihydrolipoyl dehydrogenase n=1 Tax=Fictibacillus sp. WQ 8-8 TaxID=2938788 RepID=UPI002109A5EB|nr:dihydrolipoyl dehydrogenase [Fictibacillus sp. WQ 8-8]MCQ6266980.1 dihydrolipoyl dehydrogenase [Fictibacillus sp. WQ 8-8]